MAASSICHRDVFLFRITIFKQHLSVRYSCAHMNFVSKIKTGKMNPTNMLYVQELYNVYEYSNAPPNMNYIANGWFPSVLN